MKLFEDLPSTDTPINAENLNQIQDNLVVVSATEPTGDNREKVWIQKGKNLFDINKITNGILIDDKDVWNSNVNWTISEYIKIKPSTEYTWSAGSAGSATQYQLLIIEYDSSKKIVTNHWHSVTTGYSMTITTNSNTKYIIVGYRNDLGYTDLQLEQGTSRKTYEEYIEPKIYIKNDNDVYEEFSKNSDTGWIDLAPYINSNLVSIRSGYEPKARKKGNSVYLRGEVYISTEPDSQIFDIFTNLPSEILPNYQATGSGVTFADCIPYSIWVENGNITACIANKNTQIEYSGFDLCNIAPYIVD